MSPATTLTLTLLSLLLTSTPTLSQTFYQNGCLRLSGSTACPGFSSAYVNPANLSNAFPFFADVTDVASFDAGVYTYLSDANQYRATKFEGQLGCTNSSQAMLRYSRTVLCSSWVNSRWSIECFNLYNASNAATGPKMVCQNTCIEYAEDEQQIVSNQEYCPGPDLTNGARQGNLTKDFVQCTNWTTLATNNSETCVEGDVNEGNCGFGPSSDQLCAFCNSSAPQSCCYMSNTDLTPCAYTLAALPTTTSSTSAGSSATAGVAGASAGNSGLSKGQIAGIVVGSVLGGLLLLPLLIALLVCGGCLALGSFGRKRKAQRQSHASSFAAGGHTPSMPTGALLGPSALSVDRSRHDSQNSAPQMSQLSGAGAGMGILPGGASSRTMIQSGASSFGASSQEKLGRGFAGKAAPVALGAPLIVPGMMGPSDGRTLLNSVRDENQSGEHLILPNSMVTVLWPYVASLPDELSLRPGMRLTVLRIYDDAWGTGQVISGSDEEIGQQGAFPLVCVTENNTDSSARSSDTNGKEETPSESVMWSSQHGHGSNI